jgi:pimeloyl-ACP methyl ester carboxylesterase
VLRAPDAFRSAVVVSPYLPWKRRRWMLGLARVIDPRHAEWVPLERIWPLLKGLTDAVGRLPVVRNDPMVRAGVRMVYHVSCPATRASILSATRELALEPAFGPEGLWTRLGTLRVPTVFVWGRRDPLVSYRFARHVAATLPGAGHSVLHCCGHAPYGAHGPCLAAAVRGALDRLGDDPAPDAGRGPDATQRLVRAPCLATA